MQIKPITAAAGALACMLLGYASISAGAPDRSGAAVTNGDHSPRFGELVIVAAMSDEKAGMRIGQEHMANTEKPAAAVSVRNSRPKMDHHKDARACLEAVNNKAVIKCANKYR